MAFKVYNGREELERADSRAQYSQTRHLLAAALWAPLKRPAANAHQWKNEADSLPPGPCRVPQLFHQADETKVLQQGPRTIPIRATSCAVQQCESSEVDQELITHLTCSL